MPYISKNDDRREELRKGDSALLAGELNYQIFYYIKYHKAVSDNVKYGRIKLFVDNFLGVKPNYQRYNDMTGAILRCYKEIERRLGTEATVLIDLLESYDDEINKYEDIKIAENGDVE